MIFLTQVTAVVVSLMLLNPFCCCPAQDSHATPAAACCAHPASSPSAPGGEEHECPHRDGSQLVSHYEVKPSHQLLHFTSGDSPVEISAPFYCSVDNPAGAGFLHAPPPAVLPEGRLWLRHCILLV